tara:strand:- start:13235 stop:13900 length:666 start_codon:yes stop_codon:yes gene_type:complete
MPKESCLIVVPVYNGEKFIPQFLGRMPDQFLHNLLFVDDGSTDSTDSVLQSKGVKYISHERNKGKGRAIRTGVHHAVQKGFDYVLTIDADLQHPPECIKDFLFSMNENAVCIGMRTDYSTMPVKRRFSNISTSLLLTLRTGKLIKDSQCGFRLFPVKAFDGLNFVEDGFQYESEFLIKAGLLGYEINHISIPTIYGVENSAMRNISDTLKFIAMYFKSFFW